MSQVGDNQCLLQSLKDSPYYKGFEDKASLWETRLADLDEYLHNLNQIQRKWVYLEPIFGRGALPREQGRFKRVDDDFRFVVSESVGDLYILKSTIFVLLLLGMLIFGTLWVNVSVPFRKFPYHGFLVLVFFVCLLCIYSPQCMESSMYSLVAYDESSEKKSFKFLFFIVHYLSTFLWKRYT